MKYSIIIPTLNEEKLLPALLKQLNLKELRESYNIEVIVSDGGSRDGTVQIALPSADIIKVHTNGIKQNIPMGRNAGAAFAAGDILIFVNADVIFDNILSFFDYIDKFFAPSEYSALTCRVEVFPWEQTASDKLFHGIYNSYFRILNSIGVGMGRGECQVIRREVFKDSGGYNEGMAAGEDFDLYRRIMKKGRILFARDLVVYESPRRYRKYGYKTVTLAWMKNGLSVIFKNRSVNKEWEQVR